MRTGRGCDVADYAAAVVLKELILKHWKDLIASVFFVDWRSGVVCIEELVVSVTSESPPPLTAL